MSVEHSHGKPRPALPRLHRLPVIDAAATAAADRDPMTGRFVPGNTSSRRRKLIRVARTLPWLDEGRCEPWLVPYVRAAKEHAADLLDSLPPGGALLSPLAEELAGARIVYRALLAKGLEGDAKALEAARAWLRESRQHAIALQALLSRTSPDDAGQQADMGKLIAEASKPRAERKGP